MVNGIAAGHAERLDHYNSDNQNKQHNKTDYHTEGERRAGLYREFDSLVS